MSSGDPGIRIAEYLLFIFFSGPAGRDIYSFWPGNTGSVALPFLLRLRSDLVYAWMNGWLASVCASRGFCCSDDLIAVCPPPVLSQQKALLWSWFPVCHNTVSICLKHYKEDQVFFLLFYYYNILQDTKMHASSVWSPSSRSELFGSSPAPLFYTYRQISKQHVSF